MLIILGIMVNVYQSFGGKIDELDKINAAVSDLTGEVQEKQSMIKNCIHTALNHVQDLRLKLFYYFYYYYCFSNKFFFSKMIAETTSSVLSKINLFYKCIYIYIYIYIYTYISYSIQCELGLRFIYLHILSYIL